MKMKREATEATLRPDLTPSHSTDRRKIEKAFLQGAKALKIHLDKETDRLAGLIKPGASEFEKGQLDGVFWLKSCIDELFDTEA